MKTIGLLGGMSWESTGTCSITPGFTSWIWYLGIWARPIRFVCFGAG